MPVDPASCHVRRVGGLGVARALKEGNPPRSRPHRSLDARGCGSHGTRRRPGSSIVDRRPTHRGDARLVAVPVKASSSSRSPVSECAGRNRSQYGRAAAIEPASGWNSRLCRTRIEPHQQGGAATQPGHRVREHIGRIAVPAVGGDDHHRAAQRVAMRRGQQGADAAADERAAVPVGDLGVGLLPAPPRPSGATTPT